MWALTLSLFVGVGCVPVSPEPEPTPSPDVVPDDDAGNTDDDAGNTDDDAGNTGDDAGNTGDDDAGNTGDDDAGNTGGDDAGNTGDDDAGNTGDDDAGSTGDDDAGSTGDDDAGNTGDADAGNTGDDDAGNTGDDDAGNTGDDDAGNTGGDDAGSTGDDAGTSTDVTPEQQQAMIDAYGDYIACVAGPNPFQQALDDNYEPPFDAEQFTNLVAGLFDNPNVIVDASVIEACTDAIAAAAADCSIDANITECETLFTGTGAVGDSCSIGVECASTLCNVDDATGCGTCAETSPIGGACNTTIDCVGGAFCNDADMCQAFLQEGDDCSVGACGNGLYCDYAGTSLCTAYADIGESCANAECGENLSCNEGLADPVCEPPLGEGDVCNPADANSCGGYVVYTGLACIEGTCQQPAIAALGESCDYANIVDEAVTTMCHNSLSTTYCAIAFGEETGVCTQRPGVGAECSFDRPCEEGVASCEFDMTAIQTCVLLPGEGEQCDFQCARGFRCSNDNVCVSTAPPMCME